MLRKYLLSRKFLQWSLKERVFHCLIFFGIPILCWELYDLWKEIRSDPFFGTPALTFGILSALLGAHLTATFAALIEHGIISALRRRHQLKERRRESNL